MRFSAVVIAGLLAVSLVTAAQPELLGPLTRDVLFEKLPDWRAVAEAYQPKPDCVEKLRAQAREVRVEIYLGTWCPDSKAHVSEYFKVMELAEAPAIRTVCIGIPRDKAQRAPYYQGKDIVRLPTFVVFVDGREAGRIVETPERSVEEDLVRILGL
jgi:hypothetical protein